MYALAMHTVYYLIETLSDWTFRPVLAGSCGYAWIWVSILAAISWNEGRARGLTSVQDDSMSLSPCGQSLRMAAVRAIKHARQQPIELCFFLRSTAVLVNQWLATELHIC
jgi:hypothetical protein